MEPRLEILVEKKLIGKHLTMSLANNRTAELWQSFMRRRKEITNALSTDLISMQVFSDSHDFKTFNPQAQFEKWAAVEVSDFHHVPDDMQTFILKGGLYVVFLHQGPASAGQKTFQYIFGSWLPSSAYEVDNRPHFELLGDKYKNNDPDSEEEIWIPIKKK
jgi:AraC family transcriptional regulator